MGKIDNFSPQYIKKEQTEKERKEDVLARNKTREEKKEKDLKAAAESASLELALERIGGKINYKNEYDYQKIRREIEEEINAYLALKENTNLKNLFYDSIVGGKDFKEILVKGLVKLYKDRISKKV